jgi:alpha-ketoglutarate-dependent taurine dioxygenase
MRHADSTVNVNGSHLKPADIAAIRQALKSGGYAYLTGIPNEFDYLAELSKFGTPIPHRADEIVKDIKPDPAAADETYSTSNMKMLPPHTEWYEASGVPPRYVALWCVHEARGEGGETVIADGYRFLGSLSARDRQSLRELQYEWYGVSNGSGGPPTATPRHPVLEQHADGLIMRYSIQLLQRVKDDSLVSRYVTGGASFFAAEGTPISITRNSVLLWDNWRMLHARSAFSDPERYLRRILLAK